MAGVAAPCPCGSTQPYVGCCGRYLDGASSAPSAETLMRSRYTAYTLDREAYLLATWHPRTRPASLDLASEARRQWLGLEVKRHERSDAEHAIVEFVARFKAGGRAHRLHEVSRFVHEDERWWYVDGVVR